MWYLNHLNEQKALDMSSIKDLIRTIPDFPIEGIMFRDVTTLFDDAKGFQECIDRLAEPYKKAKVDKVIGLEARGFIIGGAIAKELNIPVLALSQLSRAVEQRDNNKPQLADLRESGSIEQDADVVMFVYREAYYLERKEPRPATVEYAEWQAKMGEVSNMAEIIVGKQRHGPTGNVFLEFEAMFTKFKDIQNN